MQLSLCNLLLLGGGPAFLFDWNGTLVADEGRAWQASAATAAAFGGAMPRRGGFGSRFALPLSTHFTDLGIDERDHERAERRWNVELGDVRPTPARGALSLVEGLRKRNMVTGVVTAAAQAVIDADLSRLDAATSFDVVRAHVSDKRRVLVDLRVQLERAIVFVGDTDYDMREANRAGAFAIGVATGYHGGDRLIAGGAHVVVDDLDELATALGVIADAEGNTEFT